MKHFKFVFLCSYFIFVANCLVAQEFPDALAPATILKPVPAEYGNDKRQFQGIPSLALSSDGRLWADWYTGGTDEGDDNYVLVATSGDSGDSWSEPLLAIDIPGPVRAYDPALWTDPNGKLWVFWAQSEHWWDGRSGVWCITTETPRSEDAVWTAPRRLCDGIMMCKPIVDSKGRWLLPVSLWSLNPIHPERKLAIGAHVVASEDQGKTWNDLGHVTVPKKDAIFDEHIVVERKDGSLWMLLRTKYGIAESTSTDGGKTWSESQPSSLPHPSARFFVRRLQSGNLLLVKHGGLTEKTGRSHLTAFLSKDDGKTWTGGLMLDERNGVSYPDGDQAKNGTIFVIYDYDRTGAKEILAARFTEEDVEAGKIVSKNGALRLMVNKSTARRPEAKPLTFDADSNADGKPIRFGDSPELELRNGDERGLFKAGEKLFTNRDYTLLRYPKELEGKNLLRSKLEAVETICRKPGMIYVFTPTKARNKDSVVGELLENGFEKVAVPEDLLFGNIIGNVVTLYQKQVRADETIKFGKWGVLVW